jgi:phosphohistidine swiveling domain-containing protein
MLPPAGSEARWREEVVPGRTSGEVMLALTCQEAKTKKKSKQIKVTDQTDLFRH